MIQQQLIRLVFLVFLAFRSGLYTIWGLVDIIHHTFWQHLKQTALFFWKYRGSGGMMQTAPTASAEPIAEGPRIAERRARRDPYSEGIG